MKKLFITLGYLLLSTFVFAQIPKEFSYQAVVRDGNGNVLDDQAVSFRIALLQGNTIVYMETHTATSNAFGLVNLKIGGGNPVLNNISNVDFSNPVHMNVEMDPNGGSNFTVSGLSPLLSVPYALYAETSGSGGGGGEISNDDDPQNEIQDLNLTENILSITNNIEAQQIDLSKYLDNTDNQYLSLVGNLLTISNGNVITLPEETDSKIGTNVLNYIPKWDGNQIVTGSIFDNGNIGIGTNSPEKKFHLIGDLKIEDGNQGANKVLTSDANGNATWQSPAIGGGGDLLSNLNLADLNDFGEARTNLGLGSLATQANDAVDISGGAINGTVIGGNDEAAGTFSDLKVLSSGFSTEGYVLTSDGAGTALWRPVPVSETDYSFNGAIGDVTPNTGAFTTLTASGATTLNGDVTLGDAGTDAITINGALQLTSSTFGAGKVLTSDANGNATWQPVSSSSIDWTVPGTIGSTTPNTGAFTTLSTSGATTVNGALKITSGTPGVGKVLTSDADGNASWTTSSPTGALLITNNLSDLNNAATARTNLGLGSVENTALSTWAGTSSITTLGTIGTGVWNGTAITGANLDLSSPGAIGGTTAAAGAFTTLDASGATTFGGTLKITSGTPGDGKVLTSDADGNATWLPISSSSIDWTVPGTIGSTTP
ncbi:beta strand repeat-containing protein, partial [Bacteroidota bacterium]